MKDPHIRGKLQFGHPYRGHPTHSTLLDVILEITWDVENQLMASTHWVYIWVSSSMLTL